MNFSHHALLYTPYYTSIIIFNVTFSCVSASDQAHQVCARYDPRGVRFRALREACHGVAEGVQGQTCPQVHQEKGMLMVPIRVCSMQLFAFESASRIFWGGKKIIK